MIRELPGDALGHHAVAARVQVDHVDEETRSPQQRRQEVHEHLKQYQPVEADYFAEFDKNSNKEVNLITIRALKQLDSLHSTSLLRIVSDGLPLKKRTRRPSFGVPTVHLTLKSITGHHSVRVVKIQWKMLLLCARTAIANCITESQETKNMKELMDNNRLGALRKKGRGLH